MKSEALDHLETMEIPTGPFIAETQTNAQQRGNLVQKYDRKFEQLLEDQKLPKLCSDAGSKLVETRQYFYTLDTEEGQEYTMPRNEKKTRVRRWIHKNTRVGPGLNIKVCCRDDRYSFEVQLPSLFQDNTASWVRIVNGDVTESMLTNEEEDIASGTPLLKQDHDKRPQ